MLPDITPSHYDTNAVSDETDTEMENLDISGQVADLLWNSTGNCLFSPYWIPSRCIQWRPQFSVQPPCRVPKDCALPDGGGRDWAKLLRRFSSCLHAACLAVERGRVGRVGRVTPSPVLSPSRCVLRSQGGEVKKDITDEECQGGCVQARPECSSRAFHLKMLEIKMDIVHFIHFMSRPSPGALHGTSSFSSQDQTFLNFPDLSSFCRSLWQSFDGCHFPFLGFQPAKATLFSWDDRLDTVNFEQ